ncbi:MAG: hypothetical protein ACI3X4_01395 [Bacteroidaceae bacterium]
MSATTILLIISCCATAHLVITCVLGLYARHRIEYLCLAWINGIFGFSLTAVACFNAIIGIKQPGALHPMMMLLLVAVCYLQSIYPLSIPMPAFLQWKRMWSYALPAIVLIVLYMLTMLLGGKQVLLYSGTDLKHNFLNVGIWLRVASMGLCLYYIINIFRMPHRMARHADVPRYMIGYCVALGISALYYCICAIYYNITMLMIYLGIFTMLNLYLAFRTLETMALSLPKPVIREVKEEPATEEVAKAEQEDFNEANLLRFQRIQLWMQKHKEEWKDNTFGRDRLCEAVGYNRHLVLQSVRSQGFNNTHEYINSFRIAELKRMVKRGEASTLSECCDAGFGTIKTVRSSFERLEGRPIDGWLKKQLEERGKGITTDSCEEEDTKE